MSYYDMLDRIDDALHGQRTDMAEEALIETAITLIEEQRKDITKKSSLLKKLHHFIEASFSRELADQMIPPSALAYVTAGSESSEETSAMSVMADSDGNLEVVLDRPNPAGEVVLGKIETTKIQLPYIHILYHGRPLCDSFTGVPADWPPGHKWVPPYKADEANCETCKTVHAKYKDKGLL